ncbi:MAG: electron transfer flavoprotein subunit alpha/FixB family protein [Acidimicrobiia bacterium]|nr:MAG: electron transfer flavoprotein subunit alpha/FixB family protein [Acidimicrobiia bacterium]
MILVIVEHDRGQLNELSLQALAIARDLGPVEAVILGSTGAELAEILGAHGVSKVHVADHELLDDYGPDAWAESAKQVAESIGAEAVLAIGSDRGNEVIAQIAARLDAPMVANVLSITAGEDWRVTRIRWGGSLHEQARLVAPLKLATVAPHAIPGSEVVGPKPEVVTFVPSLSSEGVTRVVDRVTVSAGATLATAPIVVSGGRGVGSREGFSTLEKLADQVGGVVGCSRVATNNGWRPHSDQVGQTGTRVAPDLYIACGISGAIQHWVGMMASRTVMAINTDAEAPMVTKADYALVGDLHQVVPAIIEEIRKRKG